MQYIASVSYGKDSLAMLEVIKQNSLQLDRIVHVEIMATPTIPADLPPMMDFKKHADEIIKKRYGIEVEHIHAPKSYEEYFYKVKKKGTHRGKIYGFPYRMGAWCNARLKVAPLDKICRKNITYIGIASDEPKRLARLKLNQESPLARYGITEEQAFNICQQNDLLSPIYTHSARGGCWFCHNQSLGQLRLLRKNYPKYWELILKWDEDSPVTFKQDGATVHDLETRFRLEDNQQKLW